MGQLETQVADIMAIKEGETHRRRDSAMMKDHTAFDKGKVLITVIMVKNTLF